MRHSAAHIPVNETAYFNGTRDGENYHATIKKTREDDLTSKYDVSVIIFDKGTGEAYYGFERIVESGLIPRRIVQAVIKNPDDF